MQPLVNKTHGEVPSQLVIGTGLAETISCGITFRNLNTLLESSYRVFKFPARFLDLLELIALEIICNTRTSIFFYQTVSCLMWIYRRQRQIFLCA